MRKPLTIAQLRDAVTKRIDKVTESVDAFAGQTNPQVREMYLKAYGERDGLKTVLDAIEQRTVYFLEN
jgi:hypothetical protein